MPREGAAENNTQGGGECRASEEGQDFALEGKWGQKIGFPETGISACILLMTEAGGSRAFQSLGPWDRVRPQFWKACCSHCYSQVLINLSSDASVTHTLSCLCGADHKGKPLVPF